MSKAIRAFKTDRIPVFERGEEEYEGSVAMPNLLFRFARPELVLQPETPAHVQAIIRQARAQQLVLTIKCGGHSYAGHSTAFEGVSLDLRRMNKTKLDMAAKTITFSAGCQWDHVYKTLINGRHDGFVINGGRCPFVGVGGFLLGGGLGPFSRSIGMGSDTIKEITIVTADGKLLTVKETDSRSSNEGACSGRCAAPGRQLRRCGGDEAGGQAAARAGRLGGGWALKVENFMSTMNTFYTPDWPERITDDFDATINQYIKHPELAKQLKRRSLPEKSRRFLHETLVAVSYSIYSSFVFRNDRPTIERVTGLIRDKVAAFRKAFPGERVEFLATFIHPGGKMSTPKPVDSTFFWREATYHMYLTLEWEDKRMERDMRAFLGAAKWERRPLSLQGEAAFINFPDSALPAEVYERAYWGENREELRRVKQSGTRTASSGRSRTFAFPADPKDQTESSDDRNEPEKSGDQGNDEDLTDSLASKQWEVYETKNIMGDLQKLADLGL
ncbi:FAD-binding domain-containing protein [Mycena venus]|uniref:FAD-binding domain-containing protein n=1 Tax=Mycena venus TaxID=2733690 RepID=A0A8H6WYP7_9AGAR|nr:FAD-binding domain-containing protein [Mycena venus]